MVWYCLLALLGEKRLTEVFFCTGGGCDFSARQYQIEESKHFCQADLNAHSPPSTCASAASVWDSQNVMSMAR